MTAWFTCHWENLENPENSLKNFRGTPEFSLKNNRKKGGGVVSYLRFLRPVLRR